MAQSYVDDQGDILVNPGTYVTVEVQSGQSNSATAGVLTIIGESAQGPDWTQEEDLTQNFFGPTQLNAVQAKYGTGNIVDAFLKAISSANDPAIAGAVSQINIVKVNKSQPATSQISRNGFGRYALLTADSPGAPGNLINYTSLPAAVETPPELPQFAYCPQYDATLSFTLRTNGGALLSESIPVRTGGPAFIAALTSYTGGVMPTGGLQYAPLTGLGSGSVTISAAPVAGFTNRLLITIETGSVFTPAPTVGDTLVIVDSDYGTSHASAIKGSGGVNNAGSYVVVSVINTLSTATVVVQRINGETGAATGAASGTINASADDVLCFSQVTVQNITGQDRQATVGLSGSFNCTSNNGTQFVLAAPAPWTAQPVPGDYLVFSSTFAGILAGFYQVTSSTATTVTATIMSNGSSGATGSTNVVSPITQGSQPFLDEKQVIDGLGKSLEVGGLVEEIMINPMTFLGAGYSNSLLVSASEYQDQVTVIKGSTSNTHLAGGAIVLAVGCTQVGATMVVGPTSIAFKVGATTIFTALYAQFPTLSVLASYISSQTSFSASIPSAKFNNFPPSMLDEGTFGISSVDTVNEPGRIKYDAINWMQQVGSDPLVSVTLNTFSGLPETIATTFLQGGTLAGSTSAEWTAAIDACELLNTNIITPLVSQDASLDIPLGLTDPSSTYTVDGINAYLLAHVLKMSETVMRKNRLAIGSDLDTYLNVVEAAGQLSSYRFGLAMQQVKAVGVNGLINTYQPWMAAIVAAGMQLAAGYKGIVKKYANISGFLDPVGFNSGDPTQTALALQAGLLFMERVASGGFRWISDQLTYTADNNFVYNSLQAVYLADLMTLTLIATFDNSLVGKSVAQISAAAALGVLEAAMFNFLRLKWIAPSSDAPKGYKNASADLVGGVMSITVEIKLAGLIYFVPISLTISEIQQTASAA